MSRSITAAAIMLVMTATAARAQTNATLRELMPSGRVAVEVMVQYAPPRYGELAQQLQRSVAQHQEWWLEHVKRAPAGRPVTYDPRMGITESEYAQFLALADSVRLRPAHVDTVVIARTGTGWRFDETSPFAALRGIAIDTVRNVVTTGFGELLASTPIAATAGQKVTGAWGGPRWKIEQVDETTMTGVSAHFAIGRHENGQTIIYLEARHAKNGRSLPGASVFLRVRS